MPLKHKANLYIQNETVIAVSWEISDKVVKVWVVDSHDISGMVDLCEVTHNGNKIKSFLRDILNNGKYKSKDPMHFDTVGFVAHEHI